MKTRIAELEEDKRRLLISRNEKGEANKKLRDRIAELEKDKQDLFNALEIAHPHMGLSRNADHVYNLLERLGTDNDKR